MFAIIKTGGKQYRVEKDSLLQIEKLDAQVGNEISLKEVLMVDDGSRVMLGAPFLKDAEVIVEVMDEFKGDKVIIFKKKRRQNYRRKNGHRQNYTLVKIKEIRVA